MRKITIFTEVTIFNLVVYPNQLNGFELTKFNFEVVSNTFQGKIGVNN